MLNGFRVAHFGNMANDAYPVVTFLRKAGAEADLYVNKAAHVTGLPQWETVELTIQDIGDPFNPSWTRLNEEFRAPPWLHWMDLMPVGKTGYRSTARGMVHNILLVRKKMRQYDLVVAHVPFFLYAQFTGVSYLAFEAGAIRRFPGTHEFGKWSRYNRFRLELMARSYHKARRVMLTNPDTIILAEKMSFQWTFTRFLIDTERYKPNSPEDPLPYEYVVFSSSRQNWEVKGQHLLVEAFKRFHKEHCDSHLFLADWGVDAERTAELVRKLDLTKHCTWLPLMSKPLLIDTINKSTVVADQFLLGSSGTAGLEALACGKPLIIHLSKKHMRKVYPEMPPVLEAHSERQIYEALTLMTDAAVRKRLSQKSREWILKYHGPDAVIPEHLKMYAEALDGKWRND